MALSGPYSAPVEAWRRLFRSYLSVDALREGGRYGHADADLIDAVLEASGRFSEEVIAPLNRLGDLEKAYLAGGEVVMPRAFGEALRRFAAAGWTALDAPAAIGGQDLPQVLQLAVSEMASGACLAFGMLPVQQRAAARVLQRHAPPHVAARYLRRIVEGSCGATIAMSEPGAGSDVNMIATRGELQEDGTWRIHGEKMFITFGDHGLTDQILHIVLARTKRPGRPSGGLSLFAVPKWIEGADGSRRPNGVRATRVEDKMGLRGSPTCALSFEGAAGDLLGEPDRGLQAMFTMMNTMRLDVAVQGVAVGHAAFERARAYAAERRQGSLERGGPPVTIDRHPDVRRMLARMAMQVHGLRLLVLEVGWQLDRAQIAADGAERGEARHLAEWLLPIAKVLGSEGGFEVSNLAMQVFGGHGYIADYGVEQYVRDIRVAAIYEGTNGVQAIDLLTRKLRDEEGARCDAFRGLARATLADARRLPALAAATAVLERAIDSFERATAGLLERLPREPSAALGAASAYLQLAGLAALAVVWLKHRVRAPEDGAVQALGELFLSDLEERVALEAARIERSAGIEAACRSIEAPPAGT